MVKNGKKRIYIIVPACLLLCLTLTGVSVFEFQSYSAIYHTDISLAHTGVNHLRTAETLLKTLPKNPFDTHTIDQTQSEFTAALTTFVKLNNDLKSLPAISMSVPVYGSSLSAALHVLPIAIEASQAGIVSCTLLNVLISRFHDPLNTHSQGLTTADFTALEKDFHLIKAELNLIFNQVNHLQPSDLKLDSRLGKIVATFHKDLPVIQTWLDVVEKLLPVAPTLLGIGTPTNYLIEVLDSTELRPGGGFIGNYGIATLSGGRLTAAHITDTYLLDRAFIATGHSISYPSAYTWFDLAPSWSLRDSNLDADFPTAARYAELNYAREGGNVPVQGVIAITPAFIQHALEITGPINVPEYHETVTAQNLIDRIHYYQLGPGRAGGDIPSPDGHSSVRKHFTELLAEHFLARIRQISSSALPRFMQLLISSLHSKDIQIYLNPSIAENLLQSYHLNASIQSPQGDSLFVVDANFSPDKANRLITNTLNDQVAIDVKGNAIHHVTLHYAWVTHPSPYDGSSVYRDYVRVYAPPGSTLQMQQGWQPRGTSRAFGREVWAGYFTLTYGHSNTITLVWKVPGAAMKGAKGWHYQYLIQRQAGAKWALHLQITLPLCAMVINKSGGLLSGNKQATTFTRPLTEDANLDVDYAC
jgi:hypothetical protein